MLVASTMDDVLLTSAFTGLPANMLAPSIAAAGLDPKRLDASMAADPAAPRRWTDIWSAGHSVSGVTRTQTTRELVDETLAEFSAAI
jgi:nitronate monooxygenase